MPHRRGTLSLSLFCRILTYRDDPIHSIICPFQKFCQDLGVKNHYSSPRHPQANGQTEVTNKIFLKIIKTRLDRAKGAWLEELQNFLWAYRMTTRVSTGETPFRLKFGTEAIIPVEASQTI